MEVRIGDGIRVGFGLNGVPITRLQCVHTFRQIYTVYLEICAQPNGLCVFKVSVRARVRVKVRVRHVKDL